MHPRDQRYDRLSRCQVASLSVDEPGIELFSVSTGLIGAWTCALATAVCSRAIAAQTDIANINPTSTPLNTFRGQLIPHLRKQSLTWESNGDAMFGELAEAAVNGRTAVLLLEPRGQQDPKCPCERFCSQLAVFPVSERAPASDDGSE